MTFFRQHSCRRVPSDPVRATHGRIVAMETLIQRSGPTKGSGRSGRCVSTRAPVVSPQIFAPAFSENSRETFGKGILLISPDLSPAPMTRTTKRDARKDTRNAVLFPVEEDEAVETGASFLPPRLAHLRGPIVAATPRPDLQVRGDDATMPMPVNVFAPGTPGSSVAVPPGVTPTVHAGHGRVLMGPWNGEFHRAGSGPSSPSAGPPAAPDRIDPSRSVVVARVIADDSLRENLSDLPFAGPEDMDMDEESVLREQWMEDAMTGRGGAPSNDADANSGRRFSSDGRDDANEPPAGTGIRAASGLEAGRGRGRAGRGRAASAPAAVARRVGAARISARRRTPHAIQRKAKEALANARKESSRRAGDGPGFFHLNGAMRRNNGPRNTAGVRCMQPRSGAFA